MSRPPCATCAHNAGDTCTRINYGLSPAWYRRCRGIATSRAWGAEVTYTCPRYLKRAEDGPTARETHNTGGTHDRT